MTIGLVGWYADIGRRVMTGAAVVTAMAVSTVSAVPAVRACKGSADSGQNQRDADDGCF